MAKKDYSNPYEPQGYFDKWGAYDEYLHGTEREEDINPDEEDDDE